LGPLNAQIERVLQVVKWTNKKAANNVIRIHWGFVSVQWEKCLGEVLGHRQGLHQVSVKMDHSLAKRLVKIDSGLNKHTVTDTLNTHTHT
jgi:hypothetical protein